MKNWNLRSFVSGVLATVLCAGLIGTASASIGQRTMVADYQNIRITLDGKEITPTDANGNSVEPFSVDGTTYLPVRAIGSALGLGVDWDGDTGTVVLTTPSQAPSPESSLPPLLPVQTAAPDEPGSDDWFDKLSDNEKHDLTFAFLRSWIQTAQNSTVGGDPEYCETSQNENGSDKYSIRYSEGKDLITLCLQKAYKGGVYYSYVCLPNDYSTVIFTDFAAYSSSYSTSSSFDGSGYIHIPTFGSGSEYHFDDYSGSDDLLGGYEELAQLMYLGSVEFADYIFDTYISQYGPYSIEDLGFDLDCLGF